MEVKAQMSKLGNEIVQLLRESVIIQGLMALGVLATIVFMITTGRGDMLSKEFWLVAGTVFGFYFRSKNDNEVRRLTKHAHENH